MNICILTLDKNSVGESGHRIMYKMAVVMATAGHDVSLVIENKLECGIPVSFDQVKIVTTPVALRIPFFRGGFSPGLVLYRLWLVLTNKYDVIHANPGFRPAIVLPVIFARYFTRSIIVEEVWEWFGPGGVGSSRKGIISRLVGFYDQLFERTSKLVAHGLIVISTPLKQRFPWHRNCVVLHGAAESDVLKECALDEARTLLGIRRDLFIFGMCNLDAGDHKDNLPAFIALASILEKEPSARLLVTGNRDYIEKQVYEIINSKLIIYPGWVSFDQYGLYLSSCDIFVLPYPPTNRNLGRWPNKLADYVMMHRPVVTNPTGDVGEMCSLSRMGYLCENNTAKYEEVFAEAMENKGKEDLFEYDVALGEFKNFKQRTDCVIEMYEELMSR